LKKHGFKLENYQIIRLSDQTTPKTATTSKTPKARAPRAKAPSSASKRKAVEVDDDDDDDEEEVMPVTKKKKLPVKSAAIVKDEAVEDEDDSGTSVDEKDAGMTDGKIKEETDDEDAMDDDLAIIGTKKANPASKKAIVKTKVDDE
jgi:hypothetical protein